MRNKLAIFIVLLALQFGFSGCYTEVPYYSPYRNYHNYGKSTYWGAPHHHAQFTFDKSEQSYHKTGRRANSRHSNYHNGASYYR